MGENEIFSVAIMRFAAIYLRKSSPDLQASGTTIKVFGTFYMRHITSPKCRLIPETAAFRACKEI